MPVGMTPSFPTWVYSGAMTQHADGPFLFRFRTTPG
jgi:hypothetical protein